MAKCFAACGCDDGEGVTKADLDRFTDKIENVLNDEKGRKLFRNFMYSSKMRDGRRTLDFWEHADRLLIFKHDTEGSSDRGYYRDLDRLIDEAERIEELDFSVMERLTMARDSENKAAVNDILKELKSESAKAMRNEYNAFRRHFIPPK